MKPLPPRQRRDVAVLVQEPTLFGSDEQSTKEPAPAKLLAHWPLREDARDIAVDAAERSLIALQLLFESAHHLLHLR